MGKGTGYVKKDNGHKDLAGLKEKSFITMPSTQIPKSS